VDHGTEQNVSAVTTHC